jgi:DNA (cytosine-5)-methyltransferase 1
MVRRQLRNINMNAIKDLAKAEDRMFNIQSSGGSDKHPLRVLSLFSGAMGLDLGLENAHFMSVGCIEWDRSAANSIRANRPHIPVINGDISNVTVDDALSKFNISRRDVDVICGGPPCQAFSVIGKRRGVEDRRGQMSYEFIRFVREIQPKFFIMENVRGLLSMAGFEDKAHGGMFREIAAEFVSCGYTLDVFVVNSVNYGCAQTRERVLIIGNNLGLQTRFPAPTHSAKGDRGTLPFVTLREVIGQLPTGDHELLDFSARKKRYLGLIPMGGNWRSLPIEVQKESMGKAWYLKGGRSAYWRRLSWNSPSPTLVTMPNHASTSLCHPEETRVLSVAEYGAIQGFPYDWKFCGRTADKYKQIGNAVPIVLGTMAGLAVRNSLASKIQRPPEFPQISETHIRPHVRVNQYYRDGNVFSDEDYGVKNAA